MFDEIKNFDRIQRLVFATCCSQWHKKSCEWSYYNRTSRWVVHKSAQIVKPVDQKHDIWQSIVHDWWYNHEWLMIRPICESELQVRSFEHVQKPCCDRFCYYDRPRPIRPLVPCFCDLSYDSHLFVSYIGCNLFESLVWLTPHIFKHLAATDFAITIVHDV